ncbi:MAG: anti-sigma factor [Deltaproteobacteria bacterium]|nr:anti-sigma factor [Deltaproteobacteria bacterium]
MRCRHVQKRLSAYQDREVSRKEREQIANHLEGCPACRSAYDELEQAWQVLAMIPEIDAAPGFEKRLAEKIRALPEPRSHWRFPWISWGDQWRLAPAMALGVALIGITLGAYLGNLLVGGGSQTALSQAGALQTGGEIHAFRAFAAAPPGSLGDGYLRLAAFTEDRR